MWEVKFQIILILDFVKIKKNETTLQCFGKPAFKPNLCWGQILFVLSYPVISDSRWKFQTVKYQSILELRVKLEIIYSDSFIQIKDLMPKILKIKSTMQNLTSPSGDILILYNCPSLQKVEMF